ncbi:MAG TPA: hypothetical protein VF353_04390 [Candidatus Binatia bacterium]
MKQIKVPRLLILILITFNAGIATAESPHFHVSPAPLVSSNGQLQGAVLLSGKYQRPAPLKVVKSRSFCGLTVPNETLLVDPGGGVRNAVVILRPLDRTVNVKPGSILLDNKRCAFTPHVQIAGIGSELLLKNSDPILHTVHARLGKETLFNVGLPQWRQVSKVLDRLGVIRIDCDVLHTWMSAAVVVVSTPYAAVTGEDGSFIMDEIPAGKYTVEIWHEVLGTKKAQISVPQSGTISLEAVYGQIPG